MKGIVITEKNKNWVYGRLKKFFGHQRFVCWHQFSGGMRKRIGHVIELSSSRQKIDIRRYRNIRYNMCEVGGKEYLRIHISPNEGMVFYPGTEVWFLGDRILTKEPMPSSFRPGRNYCYMCYQIARGFDLSMFDHDVSGWGTYGTERADPQKFYYNV